MLAYLLTSTPAAPALTGLLALADRSHHVAVEQTVHGLAVVLHHDGFNPLTHHHGFVARALTLIAQRPAEANPDHVIQFTGSAPSEPCSALVIKRASPSSVPEVFAPSHQELRPKLLTAASKTRSRASPDSSGVLLSFRSTVLLI